MYMDMLLCSPQSGQLQWYGNSATGLPDRAVVILVRLMGEVLNAWKLHSSVLIHVSGWSKKAQSPPIFFTLFPVVKWNNLMEIGGGWERKNTYFLKRTLLLAGSIVATILFFLLPSVASSLAAPGTGNSIAIPNVQEQGYILTSKSM